MADYEEEDHLAYGDQPADSGDGAAERGFRSGFGSFLGKLGNIAHDIHSELTGRQTSIQPPSGQASGHRFDSFVGPREGNNAKWYVDGCGYFWAVSVALEQAQESIWILDWWLSPELYLRRPPAKNEQYRLDRMLQAAAERGVKINIVVYKEVSAALTRTLLNPILPEYLVSLLPKSQWPLDHLSELGIRLTFHSLELAEKEYPLIKPPVTVDSAHTKHFLEELHPNISVFRHPNHVPDREVLQDSFVSSFQNLRLNAGTVAKLPLDVLKGLYGMSEENVLYWAHHEKLCIVDSTSAFMGGLDMCFGRWDANQHSIADAHPGDLEAIVWPGQDYNNCRVMDFADVSKWEDNKLDRKAGSRAGWSDVSIGLRGPVVQDLREHFVQRWNFIYDEKYVFRNDTRYLRLELDANSGFGSDGYDGDGISHQGHHMRTRIHDRMHQAEERYLGIQHEQPDNLQGVNNCQLVRSASKWSHGVETEHSIANAYANLIRQANHFIYIENQFFITATGGNQQPIKNTIGGAIVERIIRAAETGRNFQIIVVIPAIPGFAGDLKEDSSLGTRAIMEYQYNSINRGGHSIMEEIRKAGYNPDHYIRFYNLRNYDRINTSSVMKQVEAQSGVDYEAARREFDGRVGGYQGGSEERIYGQPEENDYDRYQQAANNIGDRQGLGNTRWDSVAECYMLNGPDIRDVPWEEGDTKEIDAFVSEELYVHTKVMIVDDRIVVCGSANLNDRSQLGDHDSEIAMVIEDDEPLDSYMNGQEWRASRFAATLRRQLMRKHLGLIPSQSIEQPDNNFMPPGVDNDYDFDSAEDQLVADPLSTNLINFWIDRAHTNTEAFARVFHAVPDDRVRTWKDYGEFYEKYFHDAAEVEDGKEPTKETQVLWGHVVKEDFSPGDEGAREVKEVLATIKGTLVEMPLNFLIDEDIAKVGLTLNAFTEEVYT